MHKTVHDSDFSIHEKDHEFTYQKGLTEKLDSDISDFDQHKLNEIVLWKVNRYAQFTDELIFDLNKIDPDTSIIDEDLTRKILLQLLKTKGVQLAMASTILRFRNPEIYQIIDQRVFRILYPGQELKLSTSKSEANFKSQIDLYFKYINDLQEICQELGIPFRKSDRILFMADKRINKEYKLRN